MLEKLKCNHIDISVRDIPEDVIDFDSLIPESDNLSDDELAEIARVEEKQKAGQGTDSMPMSIYNGLLEYFLNKRDFRTVLWLTLQANTGLRYSDICKFRKIDLLNEHNKFRESILQTERKTGKKRVNFINDAVKMAALMYLWDNPQIKPLDLLITANKSAKRKGYEMETYIDKNGKEKALKVNGKFVYKLDEYGNKIPKALSRAQACKVLRDGLIYGLGVSIKNDGRTKNNDEAYLTLASHSLRKAYSQAVIEQFVNMFDSDLAYAHAAAMEQLQYDLNHSSRAMSYHYIGDYVETKRKINMNMNLGIDVLREYFKVETINYLANKR